MFDVGFWELVVVFVLGLLVLGPDKLPRVARNVALMPPPWREISA